MTFSAAQQRLIREDIFRWLDEQMVRQGSPQFTRKKLQTYTFEGTQINLLDTSRGIRNPKYFDSTLSVMTGIKQDTGYMDQMLSDRVIKYSLEADYGAYEGSNRKLMYALENSDPIIYFKAAAAGIYEAHYPVFVRSYDPKDKVVYLELEEEFIVYGDPVKLVTDKKFYKEQIVAIRQKQQRFRAHVMNAYNAICSVCRLSQYTLIDAAHITPYSEAASIEHVRNGLALCKLHHSAYDQNILGISQDYLIRVHGSLLLSGDNSESLKVNFIDLDGKTLLVPQQYALQPDRDRLAERFKQFNEL